MGNFTDQVEKLRKAYDADKNPCRHPHLAFQEGGQYIVCLDCNQHYFKGLKNLRSFPDWTGQFDGFSPNDKRSNPLSPPQYLPKPTKPKKR